GEVEGAPKRSPVTAAAHQVVEQGHSGPGGEGDRAERQERSRDPRAERREHLLLGVVDGLADRECDADESDDEDQRLDQAAAVHGSVESSVGRSSLRRGGSAATTHATAELRRRPWRAGPRIGVRYRRLLVTANDVHYQREKVYWDERGAQDYATLSAV